MTVFRIRVSGKYALFTRPEFAAERVTYDMITPTAAQGLLKSIYWKPCIGWQILRIHVLNPIRYINFRRNEVSQKIPDSVPRRVAAGDQSVFYISTEASRTQRAAICLRDVDYVIEAMMVFYDGITEEVAEVNKHLAIADRRLSHGSCFKQPYLGCREFGARVEYLGSDNDIPASALKGYKRLGRMIASFDYSNPADVRPSYMDAKLYNGVLDLSAMYGRA